jgi:hypothetical protein
MNEVREHMRDALVRKLEETAARRNQS